MVRPVGSSSLAVGVLLVCVCGCCVCAFVRARAYVFYADAVHSCMCVRVCVFFVSFLQVVGESDRSGNKGVTII